MKVEIKRLRDDIPLPDYATDGAAALDLHAALDGPLDLYPGDCRLIPTGIAIHIGEPGVAGLILPRSGLGHKQGLVLGNLVGLIDSDYQGEIQVSAWNRMDPYYYSGLPVRIEPGMRLAQLLFILVMHPQLVRVSSFSVTSARGDSGFGSSGL